MTMRVSLIMPCRGRAKQTLDLIPRLMSMTGYEDFEFLCVVDADPPVAKALRKQKLVRVMETEENVGYWQAMKIGAQNTAGELIVNLANDLLPGRHWLYRAIDSYHKLYGPAGEGLIGFNDGIHYGQHAAHFLISRALLQRWYGEDYWPLAYVHSYGDTEISQRALAEEKFAVAHFSVLYHNHPFTGGGNDAVYDEGRATNASDERIFNRRQQRGWR